MKQQQELSRSERKSARNLVIRLCANYDDEIGSCLPRDRPCSMFSKSGGEICGYFINSVLPNEPELEAAIMASAPARDKRFCAICGKAFIGDGRRYCSGQCAGIARRHGNAKRLRRYRIKRRGNALGGEKPAL